MRERTNAEWLACLSSDGEAQQEALTDLRAHLERSSRFYIRRSLGSATRLAPGEVQPLAEDSAQEALLLVLQKLDSFRGEAKFLTWAGSFAVRVAMTNLRRRLWRDVSLDELPDGWQESASATIDGGGWSNPQLAAQRQAIWDVVREVVTSELTERQRRALNLVVINGVPTETVEEHLGVSASALYKMVHDARRKLKAGLLKRGFSTEEILGAFAAEG